MSRVERVESLLRQIEDETRVAFDEHTQLYHKMQSLESENARLRELAKAAWGCVNRHVSCNECRMVCCGCTLQSAMRELGIEVGDA